MATDKITRDVQSEIYEFIRQEVLDKGYPPSVREICAKVGLSSTSTVHGHLSRLEKKGLIRRDPTKPRAIELIKDPISKREMIDIPIVGKVQAGQPILAVENIDDYLTIPLNFVRNTNDLFILKISGNSMIEAGIYDGDLAIIEKTNYAQNGDIVVALIENDATIKRFFKEKDKIRLQPENHTMDPIIVDNCEVIGKLAGIYRRY
ncbi:repressor LexA [Clostridium acetobutylicum]|uniref:LexA repressor n=1 Tax=Clostridium acetobutylicum (strain ATCC 824 / DSM 792 / JCM 1419 / IAM 19013 / LMG 5710 / NBRC 13948 / NRRL B-527 / VKM B-1787 / 2291 / W) TaxID=272562 RepID=LEXA_CLOAB|nr:MULTISPECIES: transcriptional repressor LexA [Clostridium]Q97I23.1 RecName: Full=LexA repressor [Clostridium acetobutylicum ATCC 824]AAK79796.1 SOS regulatory protein LexA [Clostridium acetobutylicum ATCC 824]ADZ20882.1 LexA repressor [Clostridium acetobutylicum EA 2018]AEI34476.1 LexA repressor [Clostridium acetobutylicum DSM 1731]AWV79769.1 transcriptional repressor LexA [Clostridium acetobutylicum]KHD38125.1 LexA family transcriptional regulator [Clostridium acetobutylicum]